MPDAGPAPDLTVRALDGWTCDGATRQRFVARVCNRGAATVESSAPVGFYAGDERICEVRARAGLAPGECDEVTCAWRAAPEDPVEVRVRVDDERRYVHQIRECREDNNEAQFDASCDVI